MRIALAGDFDTYLIRGMERPQHLLPYRLSPGLNLLRGLREVGGHDVHIVVTTSEVSKAIVEDGPFGVVHRLPRPRGSGSASFHLWRRRLILRQLRAIGPDIVHGQGTEAEYGFSAVTSPYRNVITFHGIMHRVHEAVPPPLFSLSHVPRLLEKIVVRKARHVIAISREVENFLEHHHSRAHIYRIPNAMAPCFFSVQPRPPPDRFVLLYVGAVEPRKGLIHLVEALVLLRQRLPQPVELRVIGPGTAGQGGRYEQLTRARAQALGVAGQIEWLGAQPEQRVADALAESHALVLPSFWENMPMCVGEAMAAAVPVISTRVAGMPDMIEDGRTGLLVNAGNASELADSIARLLSDAEIRQSMGAAARAVAQQKFSPGIVAQQTLAVYESICREARGNGA
jgi:glycosyltransferase involved in cell wall biosynthesis